MMKFAHSCLLFIWMFITAAHGHTEDVDCSRSYIGKAGSSGVITSYNYPFDYRNNLRCQYQILTGFDPVTVCFTFYRFALDNCTAQSRRDYLRLQNIIYCGNGKAASGLSPPPQYENVWLDTLCYQVGGGNIVHLEFITDQLVTHPGFYAVYNITSTRGYPQRTHGTYNGTYQKLQHIGPPAPRPRRQTRQQPPCDGFTCFNRRCVEMSKTCDLNDDCGDSSDETYTHARCMYGEGIYGPSITSCDFNGFRSCNFEGVGDGWSLVGKSDDWQRGPDRDHTVGDVNGHAFIYTTFWGRYPTVNYLRDPTFTVPYGTDSCLSFWYYMWGTDVGRLRVNYVRPRVGKGVWSREGRYGQRWLHGQVQVPPTNPIQSYVFEFEATRGSDINTRIALDDISLLPGKCLVDDIACNFELGLCGYTWTGKWYHQDRQESATDPWGDASPEGGGYYMILRSNNMNPTAALTTTVYPALYTSSSDHSACLVFMYATCCSWDVDEELWVQLDLLNAVIVSTYTLYLKANTDSLWTRFSYELKPKEAFRVSLTPLIQSSTASYFAIDEVQLFPGSCSMISFGMCSDNEFKCDVGGCIDAELACNGERDCEDGSDEATGACCFQGRCGSNDFCCRNGRCLTGTSEICNGFNDCLDWTDEDTCPSCPSGRFQCLESKRCIDGSYRCDGTRDCPRGSDEEKCGGFSVPVATIIGFSLGILVLLCLILTRIATCCYSPNSQCRKLWRYMKNCLTREEEEEEEDDVEPPIPTIDPTIFQPPSYEASVDNPAYMPSTPQPGGVNHVYEGLPPSYDSVAKGEYEEITRTDPQTINSLLERSQQQPQTSRQQNVRSQNFRLGSSRSPSSGAGSGLEFETSRTIPTVSSRVPLGIPPPPYSAGCVNPLFANARMNPDNLDSPTVRTGNVPERNPETNSNEYEEISNARDEGTPQQVNNDYEEISNTRYEGTGNESGQQAIAGTSYTSNVRTGGLREGNTQEGIAQSQQNHRYQRQGSSTATPLSVTNLLKVGGVRARIRSLENIIVGEHSPSSFRPPSGPPSASSSRSSSSLDHQDGRNHNLLNVPIDAPQALTSDATQGEGADAMQSQAADAIHGQPLDTSTRDNTTAVRRNIALSCPNLTTLTVNAPITEEQELSNDNQNTNDDVVDRQSMA